MRAKCEHSSPGTNYTRAPAPSPLTDGRREANAASAPSSDRRDWPEDVRVEFEERAAVLELDGGFVRSEAERLAEADVLHRFRKRTEESK